MAHPGDTSAFYRPEKIGETFNDVTGKLYIFKATSIAVLKGWPPQAWKKTKKNPAWARYRPEIILWPGLNESHPSALDVGPGNQNQPPQPSTSPPEKLEIEPHLYLCAWTKWAKTIPH
jgi:hypothetical protein